MQPSASGDEFRTVEREARAKTRVQGSVFIAVAAPCATPESAAEFLRRIREEFHDATHHCSAYRFGPGGEQFRMHDDGEPGGSAGRPILAAIDRPGLTDVIVVVTRYFGGTKLGVGGLTRAYGAAADRALAGAGMRTVYLLESVHATVPHALVSAVIGLAERLGARVAGVRYDDRVHYHLEIRRSLAEDLRRLLVDRTRGAVELR